VIGLAAAILWSSVPVAAAVSSVERRVTVAPGVELRTVESGQASAKAPLVFVPGWGTGADIWRAQIDRFDDGRRVMSFDPRSQGESTKTTSGNTPEQRAADLRALLASQHVERPVLIGWSQAVQDIAAYAAQYGTKDLAGIILVDAAVSDGAKGISKRPDETAQQFDRMATYVAYQQPYLRGMFGAIITKPQPAGVVEEAIATAMKTPPSIGVAMLVADLFGPDRTGALAKIDCPVLIIASANSPELALQEAQAKAIPGARFIQIQDAAHAVFLDQPGAFAAAVRDFTDSLRQ
jgi:microsomal epoxide hydrolase